MGFEQIYTLLGGLGIFFFGMKMLSEALQRVAGPMIRQVIAALTSNRIFAVGVGTFVTMLVQSSSITTVMVVGLVNAGLMNLGQAIGVIFGANIGTTITGWIIAIKVGKYGLLFVGLGLFPLFFSRSERLKQFGRLVMALGFIFMGLKFMEEAFKPLRGSTDFMALMQYFQADHYGSVLVCISIGMLLTFVVQSSSAMLGITMSLAATGAINYQTAVALVLGENIGTTITALLASVGANTDAKRAARAHALFNVLGVVWVSAIFWKYTDLVNWVVAGDPFMKDADGGFPNAGAHIAMAHTLFNVTNTLLFLPWTKTIAKIVTVLTPAPKRRESPHLKFLPSHLNLSAPDIAIAAAEKEVLNMLEIVTQTWNRTQRYVQSEKEDLKLKEKIVKGEDICDQLQNEITEYLCQVQEASLSPEQAAIANGLIRAADELERMTDYCVLIARAKDRLTDAHEKVPTEAISDLLDYLEAINGLFETIRTTAVEKRSWNLEKIYRKREVLREAGNRYREEHRHRIEKRQIRAKASMAFSDLMESLRKFRGHAINFAEALAGSENEL